MPLTPMPAPTPMHERCDILIIGAGPAGMAAALAARAGKRCLCLAGQVSPSFQGRDPSHDAVVIGSNGFQAWAIVPGFATLAASKARAADSLRRLAAQVAASES